ncbi:MAG: P-II family nitrogen regulator [Capsulimonadaceae bacterium]
MKEVMAVIRMNMVNRTKQALVDAGVSSLTAQLVLGRGRGEVDFRILLGAQEGYVEAIGQLGAGPRLIPKRLLSIVVPNSMVEKVVDTLIRVNKTGMPGDGKIFVLPIDDALRIRTGETGDIAVNEMTG